MNVATIILISTIFLVLLLYKAIKPGIVRHTLPILLSVLYGFLLFYIGFSINAYLFYILSALPLIILLFLVSKKYKKE